MFPTPSRPLHLRTALFPDTGRIGSCLQVLYPVDGYKRTSLPADSAEALLNRCHTLDGETFGRSVVSSSGHLAGTYCPATFG